MPQNLLTEAKIKSVKPTDLDWKLSDGGGLFLLVKPTGSKPWRRKYRLQGKENLLAIGSFPQVSLAEARTTREKTHPIPPMSGSTLSLEALAERKRAREVSLHTAGRRTLESHQQRHHRALSGRNITTAIPNGRCASDADGHS